MLDDCKGERLEEVLLLFSLAVLRKSVIKHELAGPQPAIARSLATAGNLTRDELPTLDVLILAHRISLRNSLDVKERQSQRYAELMRLLHTKQEEILAREQAIRNRNDASDHVIHPSEAVREEREQRIRDSWLGSSAWLDVILRGEHSRRTDAIFDSPFEMLWSSAIKGKLEAAEDGYHEGVLANLNSRIWRQKNRLSEWRRFQQDLELRKAQSPHLPDRSHIGTMGKGVKLAFTEHQSLQYGPGAGSSQRSKDDADTVGSSRASWPIDEYNQIIASTKADIAAVGTNRTVTLPQQRPVAKRSEVKPSRPEGSHNREKAHDDHPPRHKARIQNLQHDQPKLRSKRAALPAVRKKSPTGEEVNKELPRSARIPPTRTITESQPSALEIRSASTMASSEDEVPAQIVPTTACRSTIPSPDNPTSAQDAPTERTSAACPLPNDPEDPAILAQEVAPPT